MHFCALFQANLTLEHVNDLRNTINQNKGYIQSALRRYLYFDYDITPLVSQSIKQSLESIENIKINYHEKAESAPKERTRGLSNMFKKLVTMPEKKKESLKFSEIRNVDLQLNGKLDQIMTASPFDKLMLISTDPIEADKILMKTTKELSGPNFRNVFRENQDDVYRKETQSKAGEFVLEFNEVISNIGDSSEGYRDLCFFLCKEVSKSYVYLQTVLREYHNLITLKEYLYSEMIVQNMQTALLKKDLAIALGLNKDKATTEQIAIEFNAYRKEIKNLQVENQDLKINVITLNDTIQELNSKRKKLSDQLEVKQSELKTMEREKTSLEAQAAGHMAENELSILEDSLREILTNIIV